MKKLLSVLATVGVVASSVVSVVACGTKKEDKIPNPEEPKENLNEIIKDFQKEVTNIYIDHIKNEVIQNLICVQESEKNIYLLKKKI